MYIVYPKEFIKNMAHYIDEKSPSNRCVLLVIVCIRLPALTTKHGDRPSMYAQLL